MAQPDRQKMALWARASEDQQKQMFLQAGQQNIDKTRTCNRSCKVCHRAVTENRVRSLIGLGECACWWRTNAHDNAHNATRSTKRSHDEPL